MARVRVVTDSTAYLDSEVVKKLGITVLPLQIHLGAETFMDGPDLDREMFFRQMARSSVPPRSVPPSVDVFVRTYQELSQTTDQVLSLHVSGGLSGACAVARQAADQLLGRCEIAVIDSQTVSVGLGILVKAAGEAAAEGQSLDQIERLIRSMIQRIYVVFFVETLDYLEREGRIRPAQALLGAMLNIKPFLTMDEGELIPMEKVRSRDKAVDKLYEFVAEFSDIEQIAILQSTPQHMEETKLLLERLDMTFPGLEVPIAVYGPTLASHLGLGALGVIVLEREEGAL
jgi:DegV family protein with EDD domain